MMIFHEVHAVHCCTEHGCRYGDETCPVLTQAIKARQNACDVCWEQTRFDEGAFDTLVEIINGTDMRDVPPEDREDDYVYFDWKSQLRSSQDLALTFITDMELRGYKIVKVAA